MFNLSVRASSVGLVVAGFLAGPVLAQENIWEGLNVHIPDNEQIEADAGNPYVPGADPPHPDDPGPGFKDVNLPDWWADGVVPGVGDTAVFDWLNDVPGTATTLPSDAGINDPFDELFESPWVYENPDFNAGDPDFHDPRTDEPGDPAPALFDEALYEQFRPASLRITDGDFNPDHIVHVGTGFPRNPWDIILQTDLELESVDWTSGLTTARASQLHIGFVEEVEEGDDILHQQTLTMTGERPFAFGGDRGGWHSIVLNADSTLEFAGESHILDEFNDGHFSGFFNRNDGYLPVQGSGSIEFTVEGGTIVLGDPGTQTYFVGEEAAPALSIAGQALRVRSDQTWQSEAGTGIISLRARAGEELIESIDGGALNNLGEVALRVEHTLANDTVYIGEGTYQSLFFTRDSTSGRINTTRLQGDVNLAGGTILPGSPAETDQEDNVIEPAVDAQQSEFSIVFDHGRETGNELDLDGHTLSTERGIFLHKRGGPDDFRRFIGINAEGSTLNIGGDLVYDDASLPAGNTDNGQLNEGRRVGVHGDENTVVNLRGSFIANTRAPVHRGDGLYQSTVNLLGGSNEEPNTFEVGANIQSEVEANTFAIGNLNVGTSAEAANVRLVNEFVNEGSVVVDGEGNESRDKDTEALVVGNLSISSGSTLDVNAQNVAIHGSLDIATNGGTLDLNTGETLSDGEIVSSFFGIGDMASAWNEFAGQVIDSSNPDAGFAATAQMVQIDNPAFDPEDPGDEPEFIDVERTFWQAVADDILVGDMNFDGVVDTGDVAPFVLALTDPEAYQSQFGVDEATMIAVGDINQDGAFDTGDVAPFVEMLVGSGAANVPEPGSLALLGLGGLMLLRRRRAA